MASKDPAMLVQMGHHPAISAMVIDHLENPRTKIDGPLRGVARFASGHAGGQEEGHENCKGQT